ncbi:hypothetical protein RGQ15_21130 [Paracoccus sp. MBLB3053]|uniref:Glycosyltransferase RgtA/B/C/D-like domain-containing protein n=1 Tax=Paracoccus aurantius TaxID=3073814 RepID=A0ABU2I0J6_9RHOB|nr:hypothetical protein [Paracoccus sp. MBLB3053]MDS9470059.1 hypothetical protein [Paracoccus sp. MBLB3053]
MKHGAAGFSTGPVLAECRLRMVYIIIGAMLLCWPPIATGDVFIFSDTKSFLKGGEVIPRMILDRLDALSFVHKHDVPAVQGDGPFELAEDAEDGAPKFVRSFIYSLVAYGSVTIGGPIALSFLQAVLVMTMVLQVVDREVLARPAFMLVGGVVLALTSSVAIYTSLLLPDILAALIVLHAIVVAVHFDRMGRWSRIISTALACFAVASHYGNPPLAMALYGATAIYLCIRRRLAWVRVLALVLPVLFSPVANLAASNAALETTSVSPLRLPILLARSIGDGPGLWYLQEVCPEADLAFCRLFGGHIPENMYDMLWGDEGIRSLTEQEMQEIRDEEFKILFLVFRAYPIAQFEAIFGNAIRQIFMVGTTDLEVADHLDAGFDSVEAGNEAGVQLLRFYDRFLPFTTLFSLLLLASLVVLRRKREGADRDFAETLALLVAGLVMNALIFGGLSAPVDRYQTRIVWLIELFALLELARLFLWPSQEPERIETRGPTPDQA